MQPLRLAAVVTATTQRFLDLFPECLLDELVDSQTSPLFDPVAFTDPRAQLASDLA